MNLNEVVYVGNVPKQATDSEVIEFFKDVGRVIKVAFMRENRNDCRTKVAFVLFENEMQALKACSFDQTIFQWNRVIVMLVNDERHFWAGNTIVVHNIAAETNEEDLFDAFGRYGTIEAVQIPTNNYAYIGFHNKSSAVAAQRLNNTMLGTKKISVQIIQRNVRVRLEDLDSFKTPRVYNELMDAKLKYDYKRVFCEAEPEDQATQIQPEFDDYEDDEDDRVYDPITNRFYDKPKANRPLEEPAFLGANTDDDEEDLLMPPSVSWQRETNREPESVNLVSPQLSPEHINVYHGEEPNNYDTFTVEIRRHEMEFGKSPLSPSSEGAVRVENIPREVYDGDIVQYFAKFGLIKSIEINQSTNCMFNKVYTVHYEQPSTAKKVLDCFMRKCEFSGVICSMFTLRPDDIVQEVSGKCVIVDYLSESVVYEDVVDAFRHVGQVAYLKRTSRNNTPSVVHFRHRVPLDRAKLVTEIDGDKVRVVPFYVDAFQKFTLENAALQRASIPCRRKPLKKVRLTDIEMKEEQDRSKLMILKTEYNANYRNPDPKNLTNEVLIYNCPAKTTLKDLRRHFINTAFVTYMRWEQNRFDTNTWKVYASFSSFVDAFNAVRMRGLMRKNPIFKHLASEKPRFDLLEAVQIDCERDDITVTQMYNWLIGTGAITFVDKIDHKKFMIVCRDSKTAKKIVNANHYEKFGFKAKLYRNVINERNTQDLNESRPRRSSQQHHHESSSLRNLPIPMDDLIDMQKRIINDGYEDRHPPSRDNQGRNPSPGTRYTNEWEQDFDHRNNSSAILRRNSVDMEIDDKNSESDAPYHRPGQDFRAHFQESSFIPVNRATEANQSFGNPPQPNMLPLGGPPRDFHSGWAPGGPVYEPPVMVPPPATRSVFIPQPPAPGAGILGGPLALPLPTVTIHRIQPDAPSLPARQQGDLREYLAEKRNTRPRDAYDPTAEFSHELDNINSDRPISPKEIDRIENYIREKEIQIQNRLHLLDKQLTDVGGPSQDTRPRERSVSPSDRKAHERIDQIRNEKIAVNRQMTQMLKKPNYKDSREFIALCERQSELDRECTDIKRQLEAKKLWLAERERSLSRERLEQEQERSAARPKSRSRDRRSRSSSRRRRQLSRSRSREHRRRWPSSRGRRSRSPDRYRRNRSTSRDRPRRRSRSNERGRRYNRRPENIRQPESLMREMRQLGRPREGKSGQCVFVGNVAEGVREEEMKATFSRYGRLVECDFSLLERYGEIYFEYYDREDAFRALEMNRVKFNGKRLRVALNSRKPANRDGYSVIVEASEPVPERDLYARFNFCGEIEFIWHHDYSTIATITFEKPESALKALSVRELHNRIPIIVREYIEKER